MAALDDLHSDIQGAIRHYDGKSGILSDLCRLLERADRALWPLPEAGNMTHEELRMYPDKPARNGADITPEMEP